MLFLKQFLRRGAQLLFGGEDRAETSPSAAFVPTDIFPVAPLETLYVRCRLRVPTPSSDGLAAAAKNSVSARIRRTLPHHDGAHPHLKFDRRILRPKFPLPEKIRQKPNPTRILRSRTATGEYKNPRAGILGTSTHSAAFLYFGSETDSPRIRITSPPRNPSVRTPAGHGPAPCNDPGRTRNPQRSLGSSPATVARRCRQPDRAPSLQ